MEALKAWGISTCGVLIIASLTSMIVPSISEKNIIRVIISAFILIGILYSFSDFINDKNFSLSSVFSPNSISDENREIKYSKKILNNLEECAVDALYPIISEQLEKYDVEQFGMKLSFDSQKNGVSIKCVNITIPRQHINSIDVISGKIEDELGLDVNVSVIKLEGS